MKNKLLYALNKSDRIILSITLLLGAVLTAYLLVDNKTNTVQNIATDTTATNRTHTYRPTTKYYNVPTKQVERFVFDPNTADSTQLLRLGLKPWQVRNIYRYRAAGGIYREPNDLARLYGMTKKQFEELRPYIRISDDYADAARFYHSRTPGRRANYSGGTYTEGKSNTADGQPLIHKITALQSVDVNTADTSQLKTVPGIGPYFAKRIVNERQRLGGYATLAQLEEIEDFPSESIKYFKIEQTNRKINVNKANIKELKRHPYINYYQAKAICDYRRLHGNLNSLNDLKLTNEFTVKDIQRLKPYLTFQE